MKNGYGYCLDIADTRISVSSDTEIKKDISFEPFLNKDSENAYRTVFIRTEKLPPFPEEIIFEGKGYRVHKSENTKIIKSFFDEPRDFSPYGVGFYDYPAKKAEIFYLEKGKNCLNEMSNSFFHVGLEALMIRENKACLHASYIMTDLGGILFTGPSGIGKSTQADIWIKYKNARLINGDRPIVGRKDGAFYAWGSPYAGSSKCYVNEGHPVSAVVVLEQAEKPFIEKLDLKSACREIYRNMTLNPWDPFFAVNVFDLALEMAKSVNVYRLNATLGKESSDLLENALISEKR